MKTGTPSVVCSRGSHPELWGEPVPAEATKSSSTAVSQVSPKSLISLRFLARKVDQNYLERSARKLGRLYPHGRAEVSMAGSYSTDLRERVLAAVEAGATPEAAARRSA